MKKNKNQQLEEYLLEYQKCKEDFYYFCSRYIILELPGENVLVKPYKRQMDIINLIQQEHYVICLKSRQIGISTIVQAFSTWLLIFNRNVVVGVISKDNALATDFARYISGFIDVLPSWLKPKFTKRNEQTFVLSNGSRVISSTVNPIEPSKTLRGKAISMLIIDEAAFISKIEDAWTGLVPSLATAQKKAKENNIPYGTFLISTPNGTTGMGAFFFRMYNRALSGESIFKAETIHWKQIPELSNDPQWYETQTKMFESQRQVDQELELQFLGSEGSFFNEDTIKILQENTSSITPIEQYKIFNGEIQIFARPVAERFYLIGVDTATANGEDKSAIVIFDYETMDQVYSYNVKCQVQDFIKVIESAVIQYPGLLIVENNSIGNQVIEYFNSSPFSYMLYKEKRGENKDKIVPGLSTNARTRPLMIDSLYTYIEQFPTIIKDKRIALELIGLEAKPNGKVEAANGMHDDLAMAAAFAFYVRKYDPPLMLIKGSYEHNNLLDILEYNDKRELKEYNNGAVKNLIDEKLNDGNKNYFVDIFKIINS